MVKKISRKNKLKKTFNNFILGSWFTSVFFLLFGVFLFIKPKLANSIIGYVVGTIVLVSGISSLFNYFTKKEMKYINVELIYGIITIIAGISIIFNPLSISSIITIGVGIWMIINGIIKINRGIILKNYKEEIWPLLLFIGILTLFSGMIIIFNPFKGTMVVTQVLGMFIIIYAILDSMHWLLVKKRSKDIIEFIK